jgi:hypothetical protein
MHSQAPGEERAIVLPAGDLEQKLLELWAEHLSVEKDQIGVEDNFLNWEGIPCC